jgi:hypothetical protein
MSYLDYARLDALDGEAFRNQKPYPWVNPEGALTDAAYQELRDNLPDVSLFDGYFGVSRAHGQQSHDRYVLEYRDGLDLPAPWQAFVDELQGQRYRDFLRRLFGVRSLYLNFHWHYTPNGCSVSPHCDAKHKLGSQIFYLNTEDDWDPAWGGETLILDDKGRFDRRSAPAFEDFDEALPSQALGNRSLIFMQTGNSWHGVQPIQCPEGELRKVFIVVVNRAGPMARVKRFLRHAA